MGRYTGKKCRLLSMFGLTLSFFLVEIVVGYVTNSMALIADSFHMLSDIAALIIAFLSVKMAPKSWDKNTYGWARAEVLGKKKIMFFCIKMHKKSRFVSKTGETKLFSKTCKATFPLKAVIEFEFDN